MKSTLIFLSIFFTGWSLSCPGLAFCQDEYQFDLSEIERKIEKKPYELGGFFEFRPVLSGLNRDSAFYSLQYYNQSGESTREQYNLGLRIEGSLRKNITSLYLRTDSLLWHDRPEWDRDTTLSEGYASLKPGPGLTVNAGKQVIPWGKGYAFNPVAFTSRSKDPDNPTDALEGYYALSADLIKSFEGHLRTVAFTPVLIPVTENINDDFGDQDHINFAAKLYLLLWDVDLDLLFFTGESRTSSYGLDFATNIRENLEIHGEIAWITDFDEKSIDTIGNVSIEESDVMSSLLGIRYLTANDITFLVEYYHNGGGIKETDAENFFRFVKNSYDTYVLTGNSAGLSKAILTSRGSMAVAKPMKDYLYFRATWKEPFAILYFTPAVTSIVNLNDQSLSITPELLYSPGTNLEFRFRTSFLIGDEYSEYGEKRNAYKIELRARYYF